MAFFITQLCIIMLHNCVLLFCNIHIQAELDNFKLHLLGDTIWKLMRELDVQVSLYNCRRNGKYSSYQHHWSGCRQ